MARIAYRFHARDLHLVMGPAAPGTSVRFRVLIDGRPPGAAHGLDVDEQGYGTVDRTAAVSADQATQAHRGSTIRNRVSRSGRGGFRLHVRLNRSTTIEPRRLANGHDQDRTSINRHRRSFIGTAAVTVAAAQLVHDRRLRQHNELRRRGCLPSSPGRTSSFGRLKQIDAGVLNVGYAEAGPPTALRSFCCMAGPTTSTPTSMSRRCSRQRAIA